MKRIILLTVIFFLMIVNSILKAQGTAEDYQRAEQFLRSNVRKLVYTHWVGANWIGESSKFWYKNKMRNGDEYILVDSGKKKRKPAFDHQKLAASLGDFMGEIYEPYKLPFETITFIEKGKMIRFKVDTLTIQCDLKKYICEKIVEEEEDKNTSKSPDGKWIAFFKDHNLWIRNVKSEEEFPLTTDGVEKYDYASSASWYAMENITDPSLTKSETSFDVSWSPDSKKLVTFKLDRRKTGKLYLFQSSPDNGDYHAYVWSYERSLPGEVNVTTKEFYIFDIENKEQIPVALDPLPTITSWASPTWFQDNERLFLQIYTRGYLKSHLVEIDAESGNVRYVVADSTTTMVETQMLRYHLLEKRDEVLMTSERDGWNHLYLFDWETGALKHQLTRGEFVVRSILHVDEKKEIVYFMASGREKERDPYLSHLYKIKLDGSDLELLTPENAKHEISLCKDKKYFVDNFSRVDTAPVSVLRRLKDGKIILSLEKADIKDLQDKGWQFPEPFVVKGRDGETDIYGAMYKPSHFDPNKKYSVIDGTYSGPQAVRTPKSFYQAYRNDDNPLAELGFIVVTLDGMGTAMRSKAFHDVSYKNLGDIGAEDHIAGIKQLAERFPYIDLSRGVGIYGHSAGGYDAAHALLTHPEFYTVGVASAGNHDHQMAKAWWPEHYQGFPVDSHYVAQSNLTLAENLQGKLLLVHGDMDNNVNPASTLRLAGKLIEHNKDFDLIIIPNRSHSLASHPYFIRKRWDYFVEHLMGVEPPKQYKVGGK